MCALRQATCLLLVAFSAGCRPEADDALSNAPPSATAEAEPPDRIPPAALPAGQKRFYTPYGLTTALSDMTVGNLAMRLGVPIAEKNGPIRISADIFNNTKGPIRILKPFGDEFIAAEGIEIIGPRGRCKYLGVIPDHSPREDAYTILRPGGSIVDVFEIDPKFYSNYGEPGAYDIRYRYWPVIGVEVSSGPLRTHLGRDHEFRGEGTIERLVSFEFEQLRYRFTQAEAMGGVALNYDLVVRGDTPPLAVFRDSECSGNNLGASGILVFEEITGNGQRYAWDDCGLGFFPETEAKPIPQGRYAYTMQWDGRNWAGPSDTNNPKGPPFPPGEYMLTVSTWGVVEESDGARYFRIEGKVPVEIVL